MHANYLLSVDMQTTSLCLLNCMIIAYMPFLHVNNIRHATHYDLLKYNLHLCKIVCALLLASSLKIYKHLYIACYNKYMYVATCIHVYLKNNFHVLIYKFNLLVYRWIENQYILISFQCLSLNEPH